jgi:hypothetical protein
MVATNGSTDTAATRHLCKVALPSSSLRELPALSLRELRGHHASRLRQPENWASLGRILVAELLVLVALSLFVASVGASATLGLRTITTSSCPMDVGSVASASDYSGATALKKASLRITPSEVVLHVLAYRTLGNDTVWEPCPISL